MNSTRARQAIVGAIVWTLVLVGAVNHMSAPDAAPTMAPGCALERTGMFNPCARLDTTQVQDRRVRDACEWVGGKYAGHWAMVPCHYVSATLDVIVERQPDGPM